MSISDYQILFWILLAIAFFHYRRHNDEFLFLPVLFFYTTGIQRFMAVAEGKANWVSVNYTRNIFTAMTEAKAMEAMGYFALGTVLLFFSYRFYNHRLPHRADAVDNDEVFNAFIQQKKGLILGLFIVFAILFTITRGLIGGSVALGQSYFLLLPMALGGLILLAFLVYRSYTWQENAGIKALYLGLMVYAISMSYNPSQRFQFLSWMIALGILVTRRYNPMQKVKYYVAGAIVVLFFFSLAGVMRKSNVWQMSYGQMWETAFERSSSKEDQNMLDGFMMIMDVYPTHLDWAMGMEHFEIVLRPIPRALWPGKPMGSYINKLGLSDARKGTIGISPSIYGTFWAEGGLFGIIICSILYGWVLIRINRYNEQYNSDLYWILKGIVLASFIPIMRGGDLPGIIAFIGMSYWPVFVIVYQYNKFLRLRALDAER